MNETDDTMATVTTSRKTPDFQTPEIDNDSSDAVLRTLSTTTRCRTVWTPDLVLRRILERERVGLSLNAAAVQRDSANLSNAARRHFGSWNRAVAKARKAAAGRIVVHTRDTIVARLLEHAATGLPMSTNYPSTKSCYKPAVRLFGSWVAAVKAAGLEPLGHSLRPRHTRESIIAKLREQAAAGHSTSSRHPILRSCCRPAVRLFGSWTAALAAAGVVSAKHGSKPKCQKGSIVHSKTKTTIPAVVIPAKEQRSPLPASIQPKLTPFTPDSGRVQNWTRDMVTEKIRLRQHQRLSTKYKTVRCEEQDLLSAALRLFGSWRAARRAAETPFTDNDDDNREQILNILRERVRAGKSVSAYHYDMRPYLSMAQRLFGSWTKAREAAGCARPRPFTKNEVLAALSKALNRERIPHMRDPDMRLYVPAACRIFGKWREAVRQAQEWRSESMPTAPPYDHKEEG